MVRFHAHPPMKKIIQLLTILSIIGIATFHTIETPNAIAIKSNEHQSIVTENETINESLIISAENVQIDGHVNGDVYCAGKSVTISGFVDGDVICGAQTIIISGIVNGNLRAGAQTITISGLIEKNGTIGAQTISVYKEGQIIGELIAGAQTISVDGTIGKKLTIGAQSATLNGPIEQNVVAQVESLTIGEQADIKGTIEYTSHKEVVSHPNAKIIGKISRTEPTKEQENTTPKEVKNWQNQTTETVKNIFTEIISYLAVSTLLILIMKKTLELWINNVKNSPGASIGIGCLTYTIVPTLCIVLLITIIGIPAAILIGVIQIAIFFASRTILALAIGKQLAPKIWHKQKDNPYAFALIGVPVAWIIFSLPIIGWISSGIAVLWGTGIIIKHLIHPAKTKNIDKK